MPPRLATVGPMEHDGAWWLMALGVAVFAGTMLLEALRLHG